jgi:hypothetical protein
VSRAHLYIFRIRIQLLQLLTLLLISLDDAHRKPLTECHAEETDTHPALCLDLAVQLPTGLHDALALWTSHSGGEREKTEQRGRGEVQS